MKKSEDRDEFDLQKWEQFVETTARRLPFPATPDIAARVSSSLCQAQRTRLRPALIRNPRRLAWAAALLVILAVVFLGIPPVRAAMWNFIQFGAIRIWLPTPTASPTATRFLKPGITATPAAAAASPTPVLASLLDLAGQTTLEQARAAVSFTVRLPGSETGLGEPQYVFLQDFSGPVIMLVWMDPHQPNQVRLGLSEFGPSTFAGKMAESEPVSTTVNGMSALWVSGPYIAQLKNGNTELAQLLDGHVLIWQEGQITYRLETTLSLEQARVLAASVK